VVAGYNDGFTTGGIQFGQKPVILPCGLMCRVMLIKNISGNEQVVCFFFPDFFQEECKEQFHVFTEVFLVQALAQVPVG
jgi:hypothetical protein